MTDIEKLVSEFERNIKAHTDATREGDAKTGNKHARKANKAFEKLKIIGDEGRSALLPLIYEGRDDVRATVAAHLLRYCTEEARNVLEDLSKNSGYVGFGAGEALKRWEDGTWQLDPEE